MAYGNGPRPRARGQQHVEPRVPKNCDGDSINGAQSIPELEDLWIDMESAESLARL